MKTSVWVVLMGFLIFLFMAGLWLVDVSVTTMTMASQAGTIGYMSNGFSTSTPVQMYHVGLYMTTFALWGMFLIAVHKTIGDLNVPNKP